MNYAIHDFTYGNLPTQGKNKVTEVIIPYRGQFKAARAIEYYMKGNTRIVWHIDLTAMNNTDPEQLVADFKELLDIYDNMALKLESPNRQLIKLFSDRVFLSEDYAAKTVQDIASIIHLGLSECYVTGSLAANYRELLDISAKIKLRMIPNLVQTDSFLFGNPAGMDSLKCFWVRPEAINMFAEVINTCEFISDVNHNELEILNIYMKESWKGNLGDIIIDDTEKLNSIKNRGTEEMDISRANCGLSCQKDSSCHLCTLIPIYAELEINPNDEKKI